MSAVFLGGKMMCEVRASFYTYREMPLAIDCKPRLRNLSQVFLRNAEDMRLK